MRTLPHRRGQRERAAALIIVLMLVVLLTALAVAYLVRTIGDREVSQSSFHQSKADQVAASAMDLIIGGLRQEITGPSPTPTPPYVPTNNAKMLPTTFGNPNPTGMPNLIRVSVRGDTSTIPAGVVASFASAVNSTTDVSANLRSISLARWNKHYLLPKYNTATNDDLPPSPLPSPSPNPNPPVANGFTPPDWVIITQGDLNNPTTTPGGPVAFSIWNSTLANPTNPHYAVGRFAYAIYDESSLLDANVVGYPSGSTPDQIGRKGSVAFADLTALPSPSPPPPSPYFTNSSSPYQVDTLVGWRNYGAIGPSNNFPDTVPASKAFAANLQTAGSSQTSPAYLYWSSIINRTAGFTTTSGVVTNGRTDQQFLSRQQLIAYWATPNSNNGTPIANTTKFNVNALQYLGTFLCELNAPSWKPSTPTGSSIDYATLANTPTPGTSTATNRDLLTVYVTGQFTRPDGTTANVGDLLIKRRFPLSRINGLADPTFSSTTVSTINNGFLVPASAATVQRDFGLVWNSGSPAGSVSRWDYVGASGSTVQNTIATLDQVAGQNREPNFFELLKAGILSGSVGEGSGNTLTNPNTFVAAQAKYYNTVAPTSLTSPPTSSDYQIFQIGANIINQWISNNNVPIFFNFGGNELAGIKNLPYLNKLVFKPYWTKTGSKYHFDAWLLPSLWNPHQNAPPPSSQNVRIVMTTGTLTATTLNPSMPITPITGTATQYMTIDASTFGTSPSAPTAVVDKPKPPGTITQSSDVTTPAGGYYGFHLNNNSGTDSSTAPGSTTTAGPTFQVDSNNVLPSFQLQVDVTGKGNWKAYQTWNVQAGTPLACQSPPSWTANNIQDPEFVTIDPRTLRFGVWGNDAAHSASPSGIDYTSGTQTTLDQGGGTYETITALPPTPPGTSGKGFIYSGPPYALYNYANNPTSSTVYYTDLDTLRRQGDIISGTTTAMLPGDFTDRPQILSRPFQSMAELGQVFRDQPWKTLDFTTATSPDVGLLDVFTLHESGNEVGKTSLNTKQTPVLTAVLSQATKRLTDPTGATVITSAQRDAIVNALVALQPMVRKTDLLAGLAGNATVTGLGNKEARELAMRAFSDAGQTRTWNLLIDVVAQSGRYPPNANSLAGFMVEGEQHYWVHVAIDRFTGQVVAKQIEVVNE